MVDVCEDDDQGQVQDEEEEEDEEEDEEHGVVESMEGTDWLATFYLLVFGIWHLASGT